jgi:hypothetical protein
LILQNEGQKHQKRRKIKNSFINELVNKREKREGGKKEERKGLTMVRRKTDGYGVKSMLISFPLLRQNT